MATEWTCILRLWLSRARSVGKDDTGWHWRHEKRRILGVTLSGEAAMPGSNGCTYDGTKDGPTAIATPAVVPASDSPSASLEKEEPDRGEADRPALAPELCDRTWDDDGEVGSAAARRWS
jgi:hypothetical protein